MKRLLTRRQIRNPKKKSAISRLVAYALFPEFVLSAGSRPRTCDFRAVPIDRYQTNFGHPATVVGLSPSQLPKLARSGSILNAPQ